MVRAALILGGLGVLTAMELGTPLRSGKPAAEPAPVQAVADAGSGDTLTRTDRLEVFRMPTHAPAAAAVLPAALVEPAAPAATMVATPQQAPQDLDRGVRAAHAAVALPRPRPRHADARPKDLKPAESRSAARPDRSKPVADARSCQANAFAGLLKALSLPTGCDT
jgi:hypothetical protein